MRRLIPVLVGLLALVVSTAFYVVTLKFSLEQSYVLIYDPYGELAGAQVVGKTLIVNITDTVAEIVPVALVFISKPLTYTRVYDGLAKTIDLAKTSLVCLNATITSNVTVITRVPLNNETKYIPVSYGYDYADARFLASGLIGIAIPRTVFEEYGYNNSIPIYMIVNVFPEDQDPYDGLHNDAQAMVESCTIINTTHLACTVKWGDRAGVESWDLGSSYTGNSKTYYFVNTTIVNINNNEYIVYLIDKKEIGQINNPLYEVIWADVDGKYEPSTNKDAFPFSKIVRQCEGTKCELRLCFTFIGDDPYAQSYFTGNAYPIYGFKILISPDQVPAQVNITIHDLKFVKAYLIPNVR